VEKKIFVTAVISGSKRTEQLHRKTAPKHGRTGTAEKLLAEKKAEDEISENSAG